MFSTVKLVLSTNRLGLGGSETYLITVAEQLQRLGHEVALHAREWGEIVQACRDGGLEVANDSTLPRNCDAAVVQDAAVAFDLAKRYPEAPQVFVAHSDLFDLQSPPQLADIVDSVVVLNDRVASRARALARTPEIVRLRQPIDVLRFEPEGSPGAQARRVLVLSNNRLDHRRELIGRVCAELGLEMIEVGVGSEPALDPSGTIADADIVVGYGRSILEAMACGRAAYVYDQFGGDGWVTPERYPALEADGFGGRAFEEPIDADRLRDDLCAYDRDMALSNRDLVLANHRPGPHVERLVELLSTARREPGGDLRGPLEEMARLVRLEWRAQLRVAALESRNRELRRQINELRSEVSELRRPSPAGRSSPEE